MIADVIAGERTAVAVREQVRLSLAGAMANALMAENPRFNRATFLKRCTVEVENHPESFA